MNSTLGGELGAEFSMTLTPNDGFNWLSVLTLLATAGIIFHRLLKVKPDLPEINKPGRWEWSRKRYIQNFTTNMEKLLIEGFQKGDAFLLHTDHEPHIILGPRYAEEVKAHKDLSFRAYTQSINVSSTPGFEPFHEGAMEDGLGPEVVRSKLNHQLGVVTFPLSQKAAEGLRELWTDDKNWHAVSARHTVAHLIAKLSSRVFLGEGLAKNSKLENIVVNYTHIGLEAVNALKAWPPIARSLVHWFIPQVRRAREILEEARQLLEPEIIRRKKEKSDCLAQGRPPPKYNDTLHWADETARRPFDPVALQLGLSLAAVHTTADLLGQGILNLCHFPEWVEPMREEAISVLRQHGMNKNSITKMHLIDSYLKETQRIKPIQRIFLQRRATKTVKLQNGIIVPKGAMLAVAVSAMTDPVIHSDPYRFDGARFLKRRELPGKENSSHLVSCTPDHIAFGLGRYACPGRFFAAHEVKIAMCHILLKYDIKFKTDDERAMPWNYGITIFSNPTVDLMIRRRVPEIDIDSIVA